MTEPGSRRLRFGKFQGLGNDFLVVDLREQRPSPSPEDPEVVRALCDRRFGVGGDGVLAVLPPATRGSQARMRVLNADGSEAEMCGNGIRCVARYLAERDRIDGDRLTIDTGAGPLTCELHRGAGGSDTVTVDMGRPRLTRAEIPMTGPAGDRVLGIPLDVDGRRLEVTAVSMGNPHAVAFVSESGPALRRLAEAVGPALETHSWFPRRTNVELARVHGPRDIELVVWERGCGVTLACGTGACATAVAACLAGLAEPDTEITVRLLGGDLAIRVLPELASVLMRGPAVHVFDGEVDLAKADAGGVILGA